MTKLTDIQNELLVAASRPRGHIHKAGDAPDRKVESAITALIKRGLITLTELPKGGERLQITEAGKEIIQTATPSNGITKEGEKPIAPATQAPAATDLPRGKLGDLIVLLRRPEGASIEQMQETTGWQAHSVRGAMSGAMKRQRGLTVTSEKTEAGRIYRIVPQASV